VTKIGHVSPQWGRLTDSMVLMRPTSTFRDGDLAGTAQIPHGIHMCHFYREREDLVAALVPFFAAGLSNNERCIWITAEPLPASEAKVELQKTGLNVEALLRSGAITILNFSEWYTKAQGLTSHEAAALWLAAEERALGEGYSALRIAGNASFLTTETWLDFMDYEAIVNRAFERRHIVSLCSYHLPRCSPAQILDVGRRHSFALDHIDAGGQFVTDHSFTRTGELRPAVEPAAGNTSRLPIALEPAAAPRRRTLSTRELQIAQRIARGQPVKRIANDLGLAISTVYTHRARIFEKLEINSNTGLVQFAISHRMLLP
jgi:DNA-binding CsgD family transcriptional regulator